MKINVEKLKSCLGSKQDIFLQEMVDAKAYGYQDLVFAEPITFTGRIRNEKSILGITGEITAKINACCCRCLTEFSYPISALFEEEYSNKEELLQTDGENEIHFFHGDEIDITEAVLKQIFLNLPMKFVCREECKGFCPYCGINLNTDTCSCADEQIDPRWEKLKILLDSNKKEV